MAWRLLWSKSNLCTQTHQRLLHTVWPWDRRGTQGSLVPQDLPDPQEQEVGMEGRRGLQETTDSLAVKVTLVSRDLLGPKASRDYQESLVPREKRGTQVLDCRALQALLDLQADWASPPCSWRDQDSRTLTVTMRF